MVSMAKRIGVGILFFLNAPLSEAMGVSINLAGLEIWFPYALALAFLLIRPEGLFGEKHIDRV